MHANERYDFDLAVIGGGSAGFAAARTAANEGLNVALIEGGQEIGGLCILRGCMPTKALLYATEVLHRVRHPQAWGIQTRGARFSFAKIMARKNTLIKEFAGYRRQQLTSGKFKFIRATARFLDPNTLELTPAASNAGPANHAHSNQPTRLRARSFIVATGSVLAPSPLPDLDKVGYLDSDSAMTLKKLPKSLIVLGGGAVAVEFAQFFTRLDVRVTLIQRSPHVLHEMDADAADVIESVFRREKIALFTGTKLLGARRAGSRKEVSFTHQARTRRVSAEEIFFALGRVPNIHSLGLERIGVGLEHGRIQTDSRMRTNLPHIHAVGDCAGLHEIVHIGIQQAETAAWNIAHPDATREMDYRLLTEIVFTDPQIATVGLNEKRAHVNNVDCLAASYPFSDHGKSIIMEAMDGFVKILADPLSGEIIGATCAGPSGGELIHEIIAAMSRRMTVQDLAAMPHYHPTLSEIWTYPAEELAAQIPRM